MTDFKTGADSQQPSLWDGVAEQYSGEPDRGETEIASELESLLAGLGVKGGSTLLEAGCGSGHISSHLASRGYGTTLLDFSKVALKKARQLYKKNGLGGEFVHSDLFEISPQSVGTHDVVWNSGVLEHFDGWQIVGAMQKMASVAARFVIILVPNPKSLAYLDFRRKALEEGSWQWGLEILRENMEDLALLSGLEIVEQRFVGQTHLKYFEEFTDAKKTGGAVPEDQKYLKMVVARPVQSGLDAESKAALLLKILKNDSAVLRQTYYNDVTILMERLRSVGIKADKDEALIARLRGDLEFSKYTATGLQESLEAQKKANSELEGALDSARQEASELRESLDRQHKANLDLENSLDFERKRVDALLNTKTWRLTKLYEKKFQGNITGKIIEKAVDLALGHDGPGAGREGARQDGAGSKKEGPDAQDEIRSIIKKSGSVKGIIVYPPTVDWNIPLLQRPQHMARHLARNGWLYFYCTTNAYDSVSGFEEISENLYLTDKFEELVEVLDSFFMFVHCAHPTLSVPRLKDLGSKATLIYDYLDEIHPDVSGLKPRDVLERHTYMIKNSTAVVATARKLFSEVAGLRKGGVHLLPNAVDYEHFHRRPEPGAMPREMRKIRDSGGPILGYFGAIAKWFDYELVKQIARANPGWNIVLIGWDYDDTIRQSGIDRFGNIHYLGIKGYDVLPEYAVWFDVCILPFVLNDITHSTSPIKLFEYMALGKPIVATPIREVGNYKSPLVAETPEEFTEKTNLALGLKDDPEYLELVDGEARENTWKKRFDDLDGILGSLSGS